MMVSPGVIALAEPSDCYGLYVTFEPKFGVQQ
jgi:hypothetical protein